MNLSRALLPEKYLHETEFSMPSSPLNSEFPSQVFISPYMVDACCRPLLCQITRRYKRK